MAIRFAAALAAALGLAGAAQAQSCVALGPQATQCRFLLSQPQVMRVDARAPLGRKAATGERVLQITLDGRPCGRRGDSALFDGMEAASCRAAFAAGSHVVLASTRAGVRGVAVGVTPDEQLATLPREARSLVHHRWSDALTNLWPF